MAIVNMNKFNLFVFNSEDENLLHELQKFEYVHFVDLDKEEELIKEEGLETISIPENISAINEEMSKVKYTIDNLSEHYLRETGIKALIEGKETYTFQELEEKALGYDYYPLYEKLKDLLSKIDSYDDEIADLNTLKEELINWEKLDYPIKDLGSLKRSEVLMGTIPFKLKESFNKDTTDLNFTYIEVVSETDESIYFFALTSKDEKEKLMEILRKNGYTSISLNGEGTPKEELISIDGRLKTLGDEKSGIVDEVKQLSPNVPELEVYYEYLKNKKLRVASKENFLSTEKVILIQGYIPTEKSEEFNKIVEKTQEDAYYLEMKEADRDDPEVPVLLKNSKFSEAFQSLTETYALPKYNEIDPTPLFAPFYLVFFGMMLADAGYGAVIILLCLFAFKRANLSEGQEKTVRFFYYLGFSTLAWGLIYGSIFGGVIPIPGLIDPAEQYMELLVISFAFGGIHMFFALAIQVYMDIRDKKYADALFDVGFWYMTLIGAILLLLGSLLSLAAIISTIGTALLAIGALGIILTGGRDAKTAPGKLVGGFYELYGITSYIGDFVSYSRLMALGLSGGFIAVAINLIVEMISGAGIVGLVAGIVVFIAGQAFNIFLSGLSAYVHTMRLTYVEFFGKFYEGGGKAFNIFRSKSEYINLK